MGRVLCFVFMDLVHASGESDEQLVLETHIESRVRTLVTDFWAIDLGNAHFFGCAMDERVSLIWDSFDMRTSVESTGDAPNLVGAFNETDLVLLTVYQYGRMYFNRRNKQGIINCFWASHCRRVDRRLLLETRRTILRFGVRMRTIDAGSETDCILPLNDISKAHSIKALYSWKDALLWSHTNRSGFAFVPHILFVDTVNVMNDLNRSSNDMNLSFDGR
eukprot:621389_1